MDTNKPTAKPYAAFVSATSIAAELADVVQVAKEMSISVKNAKAIAHRAGAKARGFYPITDFIDEMSLDTMRLVKAINQESLELSRIAIADSRCHESYQKFQRARVKAMDAKHLTSLDPPMVHMQSVLRDKRVQIKKKARQLNNLLDEISKHMSVANVIISNSRIEAVNAEEFRPNLETIADNLEVACNKIRQHVKNSYRQLSSATQQWDLRESNESYSLL